MKHIIAKSLLMVAALGAVLTSCIDDDLVPLGDQGQTLVKILEAPELAFYFTPFTTVKTLDAFSIRKDPKSNTELKTSSAFTLTAAPGMIDAYNKENGETFKPLPDAFYKLNNAAFEKNATGYKVNFAGGDFSKEFTIALDGSKWTDVGVKYALAFKIGDVGSYTLAPAKDSVLVFFSIKNKYDGNYEVEATAPMSDIVNTALTGYYPLNSNLHTVGANAVVMYCITYLGGLEGHPIKNAGADSYYGNFAPIFTMDDAGKVISVTNFYGQGTNSSGRFARLDPKGVNKFTVNADGSKVLEVSYVMQQANQVDRTFFSEKWTYKGER